MRFKPVDVLTSAFAGLLCLAGLLRWNAVSNHRSVLFLAGAALAPVVVATLRARFPHPGRALEIFFDFYVIGCVLVVFDNLGPIIKAVNFEERDGWLIAFDHALFGVDPTVALERFASPLLSDILTVFYALYYFHPIVLGALFYADEKAGRGREFARYAFTIVFVFYVSYACYFFMPAIGPRYAIRHAAPLPRGAISRVIDDTLDKLEKNKCDAFPSGHTMVLVAILLEARRRSTKTFWAFFPFALGLILATVYCRYHYVADVLAGMLLAFLTVPLGNAIYARFEAHQGEEAA